MDKQLGVLAKQLESTEQAMRKRLMELYPKDSDVKVLLKHGQVNATYGTVLGWDATIYGGTVAVAISSSIRRGTFVRRVPVENIVWARGSA